jgi:hypothetical protein
LNKKGITLIASIMLVIFASIAVLGVTTFILERFRQYNVDRIGAKCIYIAQAGLHYAMYQYLLSGGLASGQVNIDSANFFVLNVTTGAAAGLRVDARSSSIGGSSNRDLLGVTLRNTSASAITIDQIIVSWSLPSKTLQQIVINGSTRWSGSASPSPVTADITDFALSPGVNYPITRIRWNSSMLGAAITLQFIMSDGSKSTACAAFPRPPSVCQQSISLVIKSMGKTSGSNIYRTMQAIYDTVTMKVTKYYEIANAVP